MINTKMAVVLKLLFLTGVLLSMHSCTKTEPLIFIEKPIAIDDFFDCETTDCVVTEIILLQCIQDTEIAVKANFEIERAASSLLNIDDDTSVLTLEESLRQFNVSYQEMKEEFPEEIIPYEVRIHTNLSFQNKDILSIGIDSYIFTGGAHGSESKIFSIIDPKTGKSMPISSLLKAYDPFVEFAEKEFKKTQGIPETETINSTGFSFEEDKFALPSTIGITDQNIILFYNQYEISSFAEGPVELKIPKEKGALFFVVDIL
ncbi:hypothetical protein GCM10022393_07860 [Aquimarina addita]|uniref:DUF3298 domain-containing protein n=1 Tax=Aquimarina addita TaxID=870485 RepID=A0ABP7XBK9_9FLAO